MQLYKSQAKTNLKNLKANPKDLDRLGDIVDHVLNYIWYDQKFEGKQIFKNGQIISVKNVKLNSL